MAAIQGPAVPGTPGVYFIITPSPLRWNLHIHGTNALNGPTAAVYAKFGDNTNAASQAATEQALTADRYGSTNPSFSVRSYNHPLPPLVPNVVRGFGKTLELRVFEGYDRVFHGLANGSEWYELRLRTAHIANPAPFIAELVRLQRRFAGDAGLAPIAHLQFDDFVADARAVLAFYCVAFGN